MSVEVTVILGRTRLVFEPSLPSNMYPPGYQYLAGSLYRVHIQARIDCEPGATHGLLASPAAAQA